MGAGLNQVIRYQPLSPLLVKSLLHGGLPPVSLDHSTLYIILEELNGAGLNQVIRYQPLSSLLVKSLLHGGLPPVSLDHSTLYVILEELNGGGVKPGNTIPTFIPPSG